MKPLDPMSRCSACGKLARDWANAEDECPCGDGRWLAPIKVTPFVVRILQVVQAGKAAHHGRGPRARWVARKLWPDHVGWKKHSNVGTNGSAQGVGMPRAAGVQLWRLERAGLLRHRLEFGAVRCRGGRARNGVVAEWWELTTEGRKIADSSPTGVVS